MIKKAVVILGAAILSSMLVLTTASAFVIEQIKYEGLQRVPLSTLQGDMPVSVSDNLTPALSDTIIHHLNQTGFFNDVQLYQVDHTLVIKVHERPTIAKINFSGNKLVKKDKLDEILTQLGLTVGSIFQPTVLHQAKTALQSQYMQQSHYAVRVTTEVEKLPRNRVNVSIHISEGLTAKIKRIVIIGAHTFSQKVLLKQLKISTPGLWTFFSGKDKYAQVKMDASLQALQSFYMDRGYIHFYVNSVQSSIGPDYKHFYITISIDEGDQYTFDQYHLKGQFILPESELQSLIEVEPGQVFSRAKVIDSVKAIQDKLADIGYAFAMVNPVPTINDKNKTVAMTFYINPGDKMYIKKIDFWGNNVINDKALRQRMKIFEGATYSKDDIDQSTLALKQLAYIQDVQEQATPVAGTNDQVDVNYQIKERTANSVRLSVGYSELDKFLLGGSLHMPDVFGTGNMFNISTQVSKPAQSLNFTFIQPYFTMSGISQSITLYGSRIDNSQRNLVDYTTNSFGAKLDYAFPLSNWNYFNFGGGYDYTKLLQPKNNTSSTVTHFLAQQGGRDYFNTFTLTSGWSRNTTNSMYFPTQGERFGLSGILAVPGSDLTWYKLFTSASWYHAIWERYTISLYGSVNYGDGYGKTNELPFFDNFYGGGWGSIRGFAAGSLGPKDRLVNPAGTGDSIGGNLSVISSFNFYFPMPFVADQHNIRMGWFIDMGNIYNTNSLDNTVVGPQPKTPSFSNLRYSTGIAVEWLSPIGPLGFSLAKPLHTKSYDQTQIFQFTLGTFF